MAAICRIVSMSFARQRDALVRALDLWWYGCGFEPYFYNIVSISFCKTDSVLAVLLFTQVEKISTSMLEIWNKLFYAGAVPYPTTQQKYRVESGLNTNEREMATPGSDPCTLVLPFQHIYTPESILFLLGLENQGRKRILESCSKTQPRQAEVGFEPINNHNHCAMVPQKNISLNLMLTHMAASAFALVVTWRCYT